MNEVDAKRVYERELKFYKSMLKNTKEQGRTIQSKDLRKLLSLITQKGEMIKKINEMEKRLLPFKEKWKDIENSPLKGEISSLMGKITFLLKEMLAQEKKNELLLKNHIEKVAGDLSHIQMGKSLYKAYKTAPEERPYFMNQKR